GIPFARWLGMWQPSNRRAASVADDGTVQVRSPRWPDGTTTRIPATAGGTLTAGVGPGGALIVASSAASHASWTAMSPMTSSWISSPPLTTWMRTVSPGTTSTGSGRKTQSLSTMLTSRGVAEEPGTMGGVAGGAPASQPRRTMRTRAGPTSLDM